MTDFWRWVLPVGVLLGAVGLAIWARVVPRPSNLGVRDGRLAGCPGTPNCVSTQSEVVSQRMAPIPYSGSREGAQERLVRVLGRMGRARVIDNRPGYVAVEFRSRVFGFVDDAEFVFEDAAKVIHFRSAARLGYSDLGVNRARMERVAAGFRGDGD